jgi:hypothetical protein
MIGPIATRDRGRRCEAAGTVIHTGRRGGGCGADGVAVFDALHRRGRISDAIDYLVSPEGQKDIADYKINGDQLFYPNADDPGA